MPRPLAQQLVRRKVITEPDTRKPIGECIECKTAIKNEIRGRKICFDCYDKDMKATFIHNTSICLFHRKTYDLSTGCPQCGMVKA